MTPDNFDHPCKDTCSGWEQGYEKGVAFASQKMQNLKSIMVQEISENDELGSEFVLVSILKDKIKKLEEMNYKLEQALLYVSKNARAAINNIPVYDEKAKAFDFVVSALEISCERAIEENKKLKEQL